MCFLLNFPLTSGFISCLYKLLYVSCVFMYVLYACVDDVSIYRVTLFKTVFSVQ